MSDAPVQGGYRVATSANDRWDGRRARWIALLCLWSAGCTPPPGDRGPAGGARDTVARAQSALTATGAAASATSVSGPLDPACQAFSDPARRAHMSAALERKLAI